jgi:hypothetical protein
MNAQSSGSTVVVVLVVPAAVIFWPLIAGDEYLFRVWMFILGCLFLTMRRYHSWPFCLLWDWLCSSEQLPVHRTSRYTQLRSSPDCSACMRLATWLPRCGIDTGYGRFIDNGEKNGKNGVFKGDSRAGIFQFCCVSELDSWQVVFLWCRNLSLHERACLRR